MVMKIEPTDRVAEWLQAEVSSGRHTTIESAALAALERQAEFAAMDEIIESSGQAGTSLRQSLASPTLVRADQLIDRDTAHREAWAAFKGALDRKRGGGVR
jgi:hypothetical protein